MEPETTTRCARAERWLDLNGLLLATVIGWTGSAVLFAGSILVWVQARTSTLLGIMLAAMAAVLALASCLGCAYEHKVVSSAGGT